MIYIRNLLQISNIQLTQYTRTLETFISTYPPPVWITVKYILLVMF